MIEIKRGLTTIAQSEEYSYSGEHMAEKFVSVEVESPTPVSFLVGDKVSYRGDTFYVINAPTENESFSNGLIKYNLTFVHEQYEMGNVLFRDVVPNNPDNEYYNTQTHDVVFVGTIENLMGRFIENMNRDHAGWSYVIDPSVTLESKEVSLINQFCSDALLLINSLFELEFRISNKTIYIGGLGTQVGGVFEYGKGKGICELTRASENKKTVTRLYIDSSDRNIPSDYNVTAQFLYNPKLMLPNWKTTGINYVDSPLLDPNNIKEGILPNEDIFPSIEGTGLNDIVQVDPIGIDDAGFTIYIKDIGFNIWDKTIAGRTPQIEMINGFLEAYQFDINSVVPDTSVVGAAYKLILIRNTDIENMPLPNNDTAVMAGNRFVVLNINMDESYILNAETRLLAWAQAQFTDRDIDKETVTYNAKFSEEYIYGSAQEDDVREGNLVHMVDAKNAVDKSIAIQRLVITHSKTKTIPTYDLSIADTIVASKFDQVIEEQANIKKTTALRIKQNATIARRTSKTLSFIDDYLMDDDGKLRTENIKAGSIDALKMSSGTKAGNFVLNSAIIPNHQGDKAKIFFSLGNLIHYESDINWTGGNNVWNIALDEIFTLDVNTDYWVYVKANKDTGSATWEIFTSAQPVDQTDYYFLPWGVLLVDGDTNRLVQSTRGRAFILGDHIYAGRLQSLDGVNYFDLTNGKFNLGTAASGIDWDVSNVNKMTIRGGLVQSEGGATAAISVWRGAWVVATDYFVNEEVAYDGSSYICDVSNTGVLPTDTNFWTIKAQGGATGADGADGADGANGADGASVYVEYSINGLTAWHTTYATGDLYIRQNVLGVWSAAMKFIGDDGLNGTDGNDGTNGADGIDGNDGASIVWQGSFASHPASPQNGWAYYNTTDKKSYVYQGAWYQMTIDGNDGAAGADGSDGVSITWKGASASPPASPQLNWVYKDTDNGIIYIYNGTAWELMTVDGDAGTNGFDVEVEYSINGSTNWHDTYVVGDIYLRQKILGVWSSAIKFIGDDGADGADGTNGTDGTDGADGEKGAGILYRGDFDYGVTYYGQGNRVDVVKFNSVFYVTKPTIGTVIATPPTNTTYWESFGASFSSVATDLLFAALAYIENLGVRNLKTADSGQRIELTGLTNALKWYNSSNVLKILIDDAIEGGKAGIKLIDGILKIPNAAGTNITLIDELNVITSNILCDKVTLNPSGYVEGGGMLISGTMWSTTLTYLSMEANTYWLNDSSGTAYVIRLPLTSGLENGTKISIGTRGRNVQIQSRSGRRLNWADAGDEGDETYTHGGSVSWITWIKLGTAWVLAHDQDV